LLPAAPVNCTVPLPEVFGAGAAVSSETDETDGDPPPLATAGAAAKNTPVNATVMM